MAVNPILPQPLVLSGNQPATESAQTKETFGDLLQESLQKLNQKQLDADEAIKQFLTGDVQDLHRVIIALDEAKLSMQLAVQVRNKLLEAYQEMMRMQV